VLLRFVECFDPMNFLALQYCVVVKIIFLKPLLL